MDQGEKIEWLEQHGFKLVNYYDVDPWAMCVYDKEFPWWESIVFILRVEIYIEEKSMSIYSVDISLLLKEKNNKDNDGTSIFIDNASVETVEDLQSLIDKALDYGMKFLEKGFGKLSEYRMTGM